MRVYMCEDGTEVAGMERYRGSSTFTFKLSRLGLIPDLTINCTTGASQAGCNITGCAKPRVDVKPGVPSTRDVQGRKKRCV